MKEKKDDVLKKIEQGYLDNSSLSKKIYTNIKRKPKNASTK